MLCRIECKTGDAEWPLTITSNADPLLPFVPRTITALKDPAAPGLDRGHVIPLPPASEMQSWNAEVARLCGADFATIQTVYRSILRNDATPEQVLTFGQYLRAVLLGPNFDVLARQKGFIDLRLCLEDPQLQRLPWEMMYCDGEPLIALAEPSISISRELPSTRSIPPLMLPLRVLFVIGTSIDAAIRPGAEFLGLLRHLKIPLDPTFQKFDLAKVNIRYIADADVAELNRVCKEFKPDVLHFICHGERDPADGASRLVMQRLTFVAGDRRSIERYPLTAPQLVEQLLEESGWLPPVVVLNACYTADSNTVGTPGSDDAHLSFAAELVRKGVAIAVGMTGEIADTACQLFTLRFYQALLKQQPVTEAATQARRTVLKAWPEYRHSVEWARPTLFLSYDANPAIALGPQAAGFDVYARAGRFREIGGPRMLCDRYDILDAYQRLLEATHSPGTERLMLAFTVKDATPGVGKTRLLEEIAVHSVNDGFVPCIIPSTANMPASFLEFALRIADAIEATREHLELAAIPLSACRQRAFDFAGIDPYQADPLLRLEDVIRDVSRRHAEAAKRLPRTIRDAIRRDCQELVRDLKAKTNRDHWPLITVDEFNRCTGAIEEILNQINEGGLGTPQEPIPVVISYVTSTLEGKQISEKINFLPLELRPEIKCFESEIERDMVYSQLVLSQFSYAPSPRREERGRIKNLLAEIHEVTRGRPDRFLDARVESLVLLSRRNDTLVDGDYEDMLRRFGT
jgi:hypothetical protein